MSARMVKHISVKESRRRIATKEGGQLTVAQAGSRGGRATLENQGRNFFKKIGQKGGRRTAQLYAGLLKEFGRKGGRPKRPLSKDMGE